MNSQRQTRVLSDAALNGSPTRSESFFDLPALFLDTLVLFFCKFSMMRQTVERRIPFCFAMAPYEIPAPLMP